MLNVANFLNYIALDKNEKKLFVKNEFCNSFLIWLNRTKSSIKVFEDTLVLVTNSQMAPL